MAIVIKNNFLAPGFLFLLLNLYFFSVTAAEVDPRTVTEITGNLSVTEIAPGVWVHTSRRTLDNGFLFPANGLLVRDREALILIDTAWGPELTEALIGWIREELKLPVAQSIITHFHGDRMGGTAVLKKHGIPFYANPLTLKLGVNEGVPLPLALEGLEQMGGKVKMGILEVFYPGPGHTDDNLVVWLEREKILVGGCAVRSPVFKGLGNTADADLQYWPLAIQNILENYPNVGIVVPGHGPHGDRSLLNHTKELFNQ